jgi:hypothetical protein
MPPNMGRAYLLTVSCHTLFFRIESRISSAQTVENFQTTKDIELKNSESPPMVVIDSV